MKRRVSVLIIIISILISGVAGAASINGANLSVYSNDGKTFLGTLSTNTYDTKSIFNKYGTHGSEYQTKSIWNKYGIYGSEYSNTSAFNPYASKPPVLVSGKKIIAYITVNKYTANRVSPLSLWELVN